MISNSFFFLSIKYGVRAREEEKRQESEDERWARLDKKARARYELARLVMGTIFLVDGMGYVLLDPL